jgi:hypothetical protein
LLEVAKNLKARSDFPTARGILARARTLPGSDPNLRLKLVQQHALCTYKDPDLPAAQRLDRAEEILAGNEDIDTTTDQETPGMSAASRPKPEPVSRRQCRSAEYWCGSARQSDPHAGETAEGSAGTVPAPAVSARLMAVTTRGARSFGS